jgi:ankyrin repeat protein
MITQHATLSSACASGQQGIVELLCSLEETDLDALDSDGTSPLCAAVTWDFAGIVQVLIDAGCDVNVQTRPSRTSLAARPATLRRRRRAYGRSLPRAG